MTTLHIDDDRKTVRVSGMSPIERELLRVGGRNAPPSNTPCGSTGSTATPRSCLRVRCGKDRRRRAAMITATRPWAGPAASVTGRERPDDEWWLQAACRGMDTTFFFPEGRGRKVTDAYETAKTFCRDQCPVLEQCRESSRDERHGVWAGTDEADRGYDTRGNRRGRRKAVV